MRRVKFNNSRSNKFPMFIYGEYFQGTMQTIFGSIFHLDEKDVIDVTDEEYERADKSNDEARFPVVGDEVVVIDYTSVKDRYGKIQSINGTLATLDTGERWNMSDLRKKTLIHT